MRESWSIWMHKEYFKFSCGHFLIFPDGSKERLHGHNYQVDVEIAGDLTDKGLVIDFKLAKPIVRAICDELDEHVILPGQHPELRIEAPVDGHVAFRYRECRYLVPAEELIVLPLNNSSVENLAAWIGREMARRFVAQFGPTQIRRLRVCVSETSGQHGVYTAAG
jgi:6-pyruvoyltetrahydropterin/6-carboxytetrahydropterin synthase